MNRKVLLIAFYFPPVSISSGVQRTLKFATYLGKYGWDPMVLTVNPRAYEFLSHDLMQEIPSEVLVKRAFALDASRHLAVRGRYPEQLARPDRYASWWFHGVWTGLRLIRKYKPEVIWSTSPVATAQKIGYTLHSLTGIPWVVDLRDPITETDYPPDRRQRDRLRKLEDNIVRRSSKIVVTTPGTEELYRSRYPTVTSDRWAIITNGFDEKNFLNAERKIPDHQSKQNGPIVLAHAGLLYPVERNPEGFFEALSRLKRSKQIDSGTLKIILRGSGHDQVYAPLLRSMNIQDLVFLEPPIGYEDALYEMLTADGLLLFQGTACNQQVPAKIFEYFRAQKPILALADATGDTAKLLRKEGINTIFSMTDVDEIEAGISSFLEQITQGSAPRSTLEQASKYSREIGTKCLAGIFNSLVDS